MTGEFKVKNLRKVLHEAKENGHNHIWLIIKESCDTDYSKNIYTVTRTITGYECPVNHENVSDKTLVMIVNTYSDKEKEIRKRLSSENIEEHAGFIIDGKYFDANVLREKITEMAIEKYGNDEGIKNWAIREMSGVWYDNYYATKNDTADKNDEKIVNEFSDTKNTAIVVDKNEHCIKVVDENELDDRYLPVVTRENVLDNHYTTDDILNILRSYHKKCELPNYTGHIPDDYARKKQRERNRKKSQERKENGYYKKYYRAHRTHLLELSRKYRNGNTKQNINRNRKRTYTEKIGFCEHCGSE